MYQIRFLLAQQVVFPEPWVQIYQLLEGQGINICYFFWSSVKISPSSVKIGKVMVPQNVYILTLEPVNMLLYKAIGNLQMGEVKNIEMGRSL